MSPIRWFAFVLILLGACTPRRSATPEPTRSASLVLHDVVVIDVVRGIHRPEHSVIIDGEQIVWVGPSVEAPAVDGATHIDGQDAFVIPGLTDMHAHLPGEGDSPFDLQTYLDLQLQAGVTTVRSMRGDPSHDEVRRAIRNGTRAGPDLYLASRPVAQATVSSTEARQLVAQARDDGADFIKLLGVGDLDSYENLIRAANEAGLSVVGHLPDCVTSTAAVRSGQRSIEHLGGVLEPTRASDDEGRRAAKALASTGMFHCPTLLWSALGLGVYTPAAFAEVPALSHVPRPLRAEWEQTLNERRTHPSNAPFDAHPIEHRLRALRFLYDAGASLLIGPDAGGAFGLPGYGVHDEMVLFSAAGIPPLDILRAATLNAAALQGATRKAGSVEVGKVANLVLLREDPLANIEAVRTVESTIHRGRVVWGHRLLARNRRRTPS